MKKEIKKSLRKYTMSRLRNNFFTTLAVFGLCILVGVGHLNSLGSPTLVLAQNPQPPQTATLFAVSSQSNNSTNEVFRYQVTPAGSSPLDLAITDASFDHPAPVTFNSTGEMFVINRGPGISPGPQGSVTRLLNATGTPVFNGTITSSGFAGPHFALFRVNELFVVQAFGNSVLRFVIDNAGNAVPNGEINTGLGGLAPRGIVLSPWDELFVSECCGSDTIFRYLFDTNGNAIPNGIITGGGMSNPHNMAFSPQGELFVANHGANSIVRFTFDAAKNATFNGQISSATLGGPIDVAFSPWGELFVANHGGSGGISRFTFDSSFNATESGFIATPVTLGGIAFAPAASPPQPDCQQQLAAAQAQIQSLQDQVTQLQSQLTIAQSTIQNQQAQINQLNNAINNTLGSIQADLRRTFRDPQFTIPGATPSERLQNLTNAILNLNRPQRRALYRNLGGGR